MEYFLISAILLFFIVSLFVVIKKVKYSKLKKGKLAGEVSLMSNIANLSKNYKRI